MPLTQTRFFAWLICLGLPIAAFEITRGLALPNHFA